MNRQKRDYGVKESRNTKFLKTRIGINELRGKYSLDDFILQNLQGLDPKSALDLGCGRGKQIRILHDKFPKAYITGVDISHESVEYDKQYFGKYKNMSFVESSMENFLRGTKKKFGLIISCYALYYSKSLPDILKQIKNHLTPGGSACIVGPYGPNNRELFSLVGYRHLPSYVLYSSTTYMVDVVNFMSAQFEEFVIATMVNPITYRTIKEVMDFWENSTYYKPSLRNSVVKKLQRHFKRHEAFINNKYVMFCMGTRPKLKNK